MLVSRSSRLVPLPSRLVPLREPSTYERPSGQFKPTRRRAARDGDGIPPARGPGVSWISLGPRERPDASCKDTHRHGHIIVIEIIIGDIVQVGLDNHQIAHRDV